MSAAEARTVRELGGWRVWIVGFGSWRSLLPEPELGEDEVALRGIGWGAPAWEVTPGPAACPHCDEPAPVEGCWCGYHAWSSPDELESLTEPLWPYASAVGRVRAEGRAVVHERGWRAERVRVTDLRLICAWCYAHDGRLTPASWAAEFHNEPSDNYHGLGFCDEHHRQREGVWHCLDYQVGGWHPATWLEDRLCERYGAGRVEVDWGQKILDPRVVDKEGVAAAKDRRDGIPRPPRKVRGFWGNYGRAMQESKRQQTKGEQQ